MMVPQALAKKKKLSKFLDTVYNFDFSYVFNYNGSKFWSEITLKLMVLSDEDVKL